ncbi:RBBP9/YdeN family alpha/beta hydrolase [Denitromonas ohlonensis]|uniref:Alpha/beta hydrolase n=2 Tax=Denitromonas TaxID=139331 RepID=A0A557REP3_9RHOO|nr:alpha/beta hydrolase [Denitromonas ohlonensis]TVO63597.1 alpha/beta hydrolase [Denitromonas ohlonensis]TVO74131.1 alpha/beta hydrolase [Denitromonas ohlonensis]
MNPSITPTLLFVPGLRDHVEDHWQTLCAAQQPGSRTVPPLEADKLSSAARVEALQTALQQIDGPVVLAAHSAGVMIVVHWVRKYGGTRPIHGALLAAPADLERPLPEGYPALEAIAASGWLPIPRDPLPFPSILAASTNDPLGSLERVEGMARDWGSRLVNVGAVGHLNPAAGFGEWPQAAEFLRALCEAPASVAAS